MFSTFGRNWVLVRIDWSVLRKNRKLLDFPPVSGMAMITLAAVTLAAASASGGLERLEAVRRNETSASLQAVDILIVVTLYFATFLAAIYFNAALVGAAMIRIRGGDPGFWDGFAIASDRLPQIIGWAIATATLGLFLLHLYSRNTLPVIAVAIAGGVWDYMNFMVIPVLIVDNVGPFEAIKCSVRLFRCTWGEQILSIIGVGFLRPVDVLAAAVPAVIVGLLVDPVAGIALGLVSVSSTVLTIIALESIFRAAVYEYATGGFVTEELASDFLHGAFVPEAR